MKRFDFRDAPLLLLGHELEMLALLREVLLESGFFASARLTELFLDDVGDADPAPALILYDESGPDHDAERVWARLQERPGWREIPFLIMTDECDGTRAARCLDRGVAEFVAKPFDVAELAARARKILRQVRDHHDAPALDGFAGDLAYMNLPDLLFHLHQNLRSGELAVTMVDGVYTFEMRAGALMRVLGPDGARDQKALYRAIRQYYGRFVFTPGDEPLADGQVRDYGPLPNLVLQAVQQADEYAVVRKRLPSRGVLLGVDPEASAAAAAEGVDLRVIEPITRERIQRATVDELVRRSPKPDLAASLEIERLYERGVLRVEEISEISEASAPR